MSSANQRQGMESWEGVVSDRRRRSGRWRRSDGQEYLETPLLYMLLLTVVSYLSLGWNHCPRHEGMAAAVDSVALQEPGSSHTGEVLQGVQTRAP